MPLELVRVAVGAAACDGIVGRLGKQACGVCCVAGAAGAGVCVSALCGLHTTSLA